MSTDFKNTKSKTQIGNEPRDLKSLGELAASSTGRSLLNIGCGNHFHQSWLNIDLISDHSSVIAHDVTSGLPFSDNQFEAVYHSHVLEHLTPDQGKMLIRECYRVLRPGGILRVVVPDLERIAELYLEMHMRAWDGDQQARTDYFWMKLELLDQMVRERSGGRMGQYMANPDITNSEFVQSRVGNEFQVCQKHASSMVDAAADPAAKKRLAEKPMLKRVQVIAASTRKAREKLAKKVVRWLLGPQATAALDEGLFRSGGEVHRWMYDRFSLRETCEHEGFSKFEVLKARQSNIENFSSYELDVQEGVTRKPDSLFCECQKPK